MDYRDCVNRYKYTTILVSTLKRTVLSIEITVDTLSVINKVLINTFILLNILNVYTLRMSHGGDK